MLHKNVLTKRLNHYFFCPLAWCNFAHFEPSFVLVEINVGLDSTHFFTGHDDPPAKYSSNQLLKLKPRLFTQPVGWVETVRVRRPRVRLFTELFANPSDRPTCGPVDLLKPKTFRRPIFTNAEI